MRDRGIAAMMAAGAMWGVVAGAREAHASCNVIPSMRMFRTGSPDFDPTSIPADLPFRGDAGRINRAVLVPGVTPSVVLGPDPRCQSVAMQSPPEHPIALVIRQAHGDLPPSVIAYTEENPAVEVSDVLAKLAPRLGKAKLERAGEPMFVIASAGRAPRYLVPLDDEPRGGRISVAVLDASTLAGNDPITWHITPATTSPCHELVNGLAATVTQAGHGGGVSACVDRIYEDFAPNGRCKTEAAQIDSIVGALFTTPTENDFRKACDSLGDGATDDLASCGGGDPEHPLQTGVQPNGNLLVPFNFASIRKWKPGNGKTEDVTRELAGRSATTRSRDVRSGRILLPGDEFIGSSPSFEEPANPWKPDVNVDEPLGDTSELQISGSVDKDSSVLTFFPRMPVTIVCSTGEACQTFDENGSDKSPVCSCGRAPDFQTCTCEPQPLPAQRYFACDSASGRLAGLPCTRRAHCGDGACRTKPFCRKAGAVWPESPNDYGTECERDLPTCSGTHSQCGYRLFDFTTRVANGEGVYELQYVIAPGTGDKQAGMCKGDHNGKGREWCSTDTQCSHDIAPCRGYGLQARGMKGKPK